MLQRVLAVGCYARRAAALDVVRVSDGLAVVQQHLDDFEVVTLCRQLKRRDVIREGVRRPASWQTLRQYVGENQSINWLINQAIIIVLILVMQ